MIFNNEHKVIIDSLSRDEAVAFVKFLRSEIIRHEDDIQQARDLIYKVCYRFKITELLEE